jgi:hypothetical protein
LRGSTPTEIRVYVIEAPEMPHDRWRPSELVCSSKAEVLDTVRHEAAHVLEAERFGTHGHGPRFYDAYAEIGQYLRERGYSTSIANKPAVTTSRGGCLIAALSFMTIAAVLIT